MHNTLFNKISLPLTPVFKHRLTYTKFNLSCFNAFNVTTKFQKKNVQSLLRKSGTYIQTN